MPEQWISEVLHFCQGLPIILVGCKKDLRHDPKTIEELHKTNQTPVSEDQVRIYQNTARSEDSCKTENEIEQWKNHANNSVNRLNVLLIRLVLTSLLSVQQRPMRVSVRCLNTPLVLHS